MKTALLSIACATVISVALGCGGNVAIPGEPAPTDPDHPECTSTVVEGNTTGLCIINLRWEDNGGDLPGDLVYNIEPDTKNDVWFLTGVVEGVDVEIKKGYPVYEDIERLSDAEPADRILFGFDLAELQAAKEPVLMFSWSGTKFIDIAAGDTKYCSEPQCTGSLSAPLPPLPLP